MFVIVSEGGSESNASTIDLGSYTNGVEVWPVIYRIIDWSDQFENPENNSTFC